jgi:CRP/FNR family transcriptional regulator, nitrogen oxide reductase regulator
MTAVIAVSVSTDNNYDMNPARCISSVAGDSPAILGSSSAHAIHSVTDRPSNRAVLESCSILNGIEPNAKEKLAETGFMAYAEKGEVIWMAGAPSEFCAVVGAGYVKMTKISPQGIEVALELLGPGQCFGLMATIEGRDFPLSTAAITNTWYLKIPAREIHAIYAVSSALKDQIVRSMGPRLRKAHDMMSRLSSGKVGERIAAVLFILADSFGRPGPGGIQLEVPLTRSDIAEMAGTTTETAIRVLSKWQKDKIVSTERHFITILDQTALADVLQGA